MQSLLEYLNELIGTHGQGALADQVKSDGALLCRFRSGQGALSIQTIQALLDAGNAGIAHPQEVEKLKNALEVMSDLWRQERRKKEGGKG
jgi:hypothetical protein